MYVPAHFKEDRVSVLHDAIRDIGFATLVTYGEAGIEANHLPMLLNPDLAPFGTLQGHMARANPLWQHIQPGVQALAIFLGPNTYVSPSWYPTKQQTGKVVPTWNYLAVHVYGELSFFDDPARLRDQVGKLTDTHEAPRASPWALSDAPSDYLDKMLGAIIGFDLAIRRVEGKWKMSQNRSPEDITGVKAGLVSEAGASQIAVADIMAR